MCILCVLQRASCRARNMLPRLVFTLVGLWAVSQLLSPPFRLEMTVSRLACVLFLVGYFSWYEFFLPQLSLWRARRSARLRERRWSQAVELQKLRKAATRRCRNCLNPYKDQNPGGGRFMCSYCGHISKRPVLDIPGPPGSAGIIGDILGRNAWICSQDWQPEGGGGWRYGVTGGDENCLMERSYSDAAVFTFKLLSSFFLGVRWLGGRIFRLGSLRDGGSSDVDGQRSSGKGENGVNYHESRSEKARRKAEEKRRARLEKEMLEEEERKQREEVARLMEEQRKLRGEKLETKKEQFRGSYSERTRDMKKELDRKRQERRKDRETGSSKSNSDGEEREKKSGLEIDRKCDTDKKGDVERRDFHKAGLESNRIQTSETATQGAKGVLSRSRYLDRVRGSFLSTSRGFGGANFFGKASQNTAASASRPTKPLSVSVEQMNNSTRKEVPSVAQISGRQTANGDNSASVTTHHPTVIASPPPTNVWKKSWHQLFTCSSAVDASSDKNSTVNDMNCGAVPWNAWQGSADYTRGSQMPFSQPFSLNSYPQMTDAATKISKFSTVANFSHPFVGVSGNSSNSEENELFEDPCYVADPISLIGPVSEALDNYPINPGTEFAASTHSGPVTKPSTTTDVGKPSPIEFPLSRLRLSENNNGSPGQYPALAKAHDSYSSSLGGSSSTATATLHEPGVWQMWGTPLAQESLSMISASANRVLPIGKTKPRQADIVHSLGHEHMECTPEVDLAHFGILSSPNKLVESPQNGASHTPLENAFDETDLWLENLVLQPLFNDTASQFPSPKLRENIGLTTANYHNQDGPEASDGFELPLPDYWSMKGWTLPDTSKYGNVDASKSDTGIPFPSECDVQPAWTFQ